MGNIRELPATTEISFPLYLSTNKSMVSLKAFTSRSNVVISWNRIPAKRIGIINTYIAITATISETLNDITDKNNLHRYNKTKDASRKSEP